MKIAYIFTTFPKLSERFFLREVLELRRQGLEFDLYSIIGGCDESEAGPVRRMKFTDWIRLCLEFVHWLIKAPRVLLRFLARLNPFVYRSGINWAENALGLAFAVRYARDFQQLGYRFGHGTWATAPGMAVWALEQLIGLPYTLEAHAYDVWRDGGDLFLEPKLVGARALRSSTDATAAEMARRMAVVGVDRPVACVRRGLSQVPEYHAPSAPGAELLRVLSVGRLIEKKGYLQQLEIFAVWQRSGVNFQAKIIGEGPQFKALSKRIVELGISERVQLCGRMGHQEVDQAYQAADLFLFCGQVSASGDRDGFPNVIGEAMSHSVPVFSTDVSGTTEGVKEGSSGYIIDLLDSEKTARRILECMQSPAELAQITRNAHTWVQSEFFVPKNVERLRQSLWGE